MQQQAPTPTDIVRSAINIFLFAAIALSLFQELNFSSPAPTPAPDAPPADLPLNGTKVEGLAIFTTDSYRKQFRELLAEKEYAVEMKEFVFEGEEYWLNLFLTHGHMLVVFFLVSKYQAEQDQGRKTKIMMLGMVVVFGWMFASPHLKTQRLALEYKGQRIYQKDVFIGQEIAEKIAEYSELDTFGLDPTPEVPKAPKAEILEEANLDDEFIPNEVHVDF